MANPPKASQRTTPPPATDGAGHAGRAPRVVHHIPGRLRLRFDGIDDEEFYRNLHQVLSAFPGVESVRVNAGACSAIVHYDPDQPSLAESIQHDPQVRKALDDAGVLDLAEAAAPVVSRGARYVEQHSTLAEAIVTGAETLDERLRRATDGYFDMKVLLPLGALAFSTLHKSRTKGTPMWMSLCTFAFNAFTTLHHNRIDHKQGTLRLPLQ